MLRDYAPIEGVSNNRRKRVWSIAAIVTFALFCAYHLWNSLGGDTSGPSLEALICDQVEKTTALPVEKVQQLLADEKLYNDTLGKLVNAVKVPTEIYDTYVNPDIDPSFAGWEPFKLMHKQLAKDFPAVWSQLKVETVNHYGLIITWKGSDAALKPAMFAAHMDVVPVERKTWSSWEHEPFSGEVSEDSEFGTLVWGRGSFDDKNMLIGILQALEYMLTEEPDFVPQRSVIVALGFDEEAGGPFGAGYITDILYKRYGKNGILSIVDEGVLGVKEVSDVLVASPGTAEKGRCDVWFHLNTPGGHSSVPPDHTSIGIAAELIASIESSKFPAMFTDKNPFSQYHRCIAEHSPSMDPRLKKDFSRSMEDDAANSRVIKYLIETGGKKTEYLMRSTHAFDIIQGGIKANALPETVSFLVDSRIAVESSVAEINQVFIEKTLAVAAKYDLGVTFQGNVLRPATPNGNFNLTQEGSLEPAPPSPNNDVWKSFAATIKTLYEDVVFPTKFDEPRELVVAPSIMSANTDTAHYWNLTENIYRYQPGFALEDTLSTIHSVNEHINFETVMHVVAFTYGYVHVVNTERYTN